MKKIIMAVVAGFIAVGANAQLLKSNLFSGYKEGDKLEKSVFQSKNDTPELDVWAGAFVSKPSEVSSPIIGKELAYPGYPEKGPSITLGTPEGVKGNRFCVYPIDTKKTYYKGVFYLACVVELSKVPSSSPIDLIGLSASATSVSNRAAIKVSRIGSEGLKFATNLMKSVSETTMAYDCDKPHLIIVKIDYNNQTSSLYVDPKVETEPEQADCVAKGDADNVLKHAIRSISLRNRSGYIGNVGNIRFARTWADLFVAD